MPQTDPLIDTIPGPHYGQMVTIRKDLAEEGTIAAGTPLAIYVSGWDTSGGRDESDTIDYVSSFLDSPRPAVRRGGGQTDNGTWVDFVVQGWFPASKDGVRGADFETSVRDNTSFATSLDLGDGGVWVSDLSASGVAAKFVNQDSRYSVNTSAVVMEGTREAVQAEAKFVGSAASSVASAAGDVVKSAAGGLLSGLGWIGWALLAVLFLLVVFVLYLRFAR
jgi:hypothetical protein